FESEGGRQLVEELGRQRGGPLRRGKQAGRIEVVGGQLGHVLGVAGDGGDQVGGDAGDRRGDGQGGHEAILPWNPVLPPRERGGDRKRRAAPRLTIVVSISLYAENAGVSIP